MEAEGEKEVTLQLDEPDFENNDAKLSRRSSVVSTGRSPRYEPNRHSLLITIMSRARLSSTEGQNLNLDKDKLYRES